MGVRRGLLTKGDYSKLRTTERKARRKIFGSVYKHGNENERTKENIIMTCEICMEDRIYTVVQQKQEDRMDWTCLKGRWKNYKVNYRRKNYKEKTIRRVPNKMEGRGRERI